MKFAHFVPFFRSINELDAFRTIVFCLFNEPLIIDFFSSCHPVLLFTIVSSLEEALNLLCISLLRS